MPLTHRGRIRNVQLKTWLVMVGDDFTSISGPNVKTSGSVNGFFLDTGANRPYTRGPPRTADRLLRTIKRYSDMDIYLTLSRLLFRSGRCFDLASGGFWSILRSDTAGARYRRPTGRGVSSIAFVGGALTTATGGQFLLLKVSLGLARRTPQT